MTYEVDGTTEDLQEDEIRKWLIIDAADPTRKSIVEGLGKGFDYLEDRLNGRVQQDNFNCKEMYKVLDAISCYDPSFVDERDVDEEWVDKLTIVKPIAEHINLGKLKEELAIYRAAAKGVTFNQSNIDAFSMSVLKWWRNHGQRFPNWAAAAIIAFSFTPNSASCERVFSLLDAMFGADQLSALSDIVQSAVMLRFRNN